MKPFKILSFFAAAVALLVLLALAFPRQGATLMGYELRFPSVHKIIMPKEELDVAAYMAKQAEERQRVLSDLQDSADYYAELMTTGDARLWLPDGNSDYFMPFFARAAAARADGAVVRIVHYGDSQIEMDRMSGRLRKYMQTTFGGGGPGFIPFKTVINTPAVTLSTVGDLVYMAPYGDSTVHRSSGGHYGPLVHCHRLSGHAVATVSASKSRYADSAVMAFSSLRLLVCNSMAPVYADLQIGYGGEVERTAAAGSVQALEWHFDTATRLRLTLTGVADIYGMMIDNGPGVAVDNVPMRGCSGQQFTLINESELVQAYSHMDVGMIIMQFGGNSVPYIRTEKALATYAASLGRQIERLKRCCPEAAILFIGPSDMSTTVNGERATYPFLPQIVAGLRDTALAHGAAYWSLYDAMGGKGSMVAWVNQGLAGSDYIHFTQRGADMMGDRLASMMGLAYRHFQVRAKMEATAADTLAPMPASTLTPQS